MLGNILYNLIVIVVGVTLVPVVADTTAAAVGGNVTGTSATILNLIPLFYIIGILVSTMQASLGVLARMGF